MWCLAAAGGEGWGGGGAEVVAWWREEAVVGGRAPAGWRDKEQGARGRRRRRGFWGRVRVPLRRQAGDTPALAAWPGACVGAGRGEGRPATGMCGTAAGGGGAAGDATTAKRRCRSGGAAEWLCRGGGAADWRYTDSSMRSLTGPGVAEEGNGRLENGPGSAEPLVLPKAERPFGYAARRSGNLVSSQATRRWASN